MDNKTIDIYENSTSRTVLKVIPWDDFTPGFHTKYNNGEIKRCYITKSGRVAVRDLWDRVYFNLLKTKQPINNTA